MNIIVDISMECFPTETSKMNYKNRNPWINENLKSEIQVRDKLFVQSKKHPTQKRKIIREKQKEIIIENSLIYTKQIFKKHGIL